MRTRFLTDFFNSTTAESQTLDFLRFPPPHLDPPNLFNFNHFSCFDQFTSIHNSSLDLETLSSDAALRKFLSDVIPQHTDVKIAQIPTEISPQEKVNDDSAGAAKTNLRFVEFETPALRTSLEDSSFLHEEKMQIFFEVMSAEEDSQDLLDFSTEVQKLVDINKSVFYVEDLSLKPHEEHMPGIFEDASSVTGQISSNPRTFPLFEVDETSLGINSYTPEDINMIFPTNEAQQWMQKDESTCDAKELLLSMEFDLLEHLLNQPPYASHKFEVPCVNFPPGEDITSATERPVNEYSSLTLIPPVFEQFQFFDMNISHFSEVFCKAEIINEVEHCEQMFGDTPLNTFNSLVVTHELTLRDDTFRSLPVPIISDHEMVLPVQVIVEKLFSKLKLQPSSTSDDIYLDWHLLEEDTCSDSISTYSKMFRDIETYSIDAEMYLCDSRMLILEFVLSETCSDEQTTKENTEVLDIERTANLTGPVFPDGTVSSNLIDICQKRSSGEASLDNKVDKFHQLPDPMSQFDDLDFFFHPLEATCMKKQKHTAKKLETDYTLPVTSASCPIEMHDTIQKQQKFSENESIQKQQKLLGNEFLSKRSSGEALLDNKVHKSHQLPKSMSWFDDLDFFLHPLEATCVNNQKVSAKKLELDYALPVSSTNPPVEMHDTIQKQQKCMETESIQKQDNLENKSIQKQRKYLEDESIKKQHNLFENEFHSRGDFHPTSMLNTSSKHSGPSHSTFVGEKNSMKSLEATELPFFTETKKVNANTASLLDAIIIVNTQNVDTDMIISRRSTYQRILAMEKEGVQVVERDLNLSVDVILSAAACLVFYDIKNIKRKTAASDNASSDNISSFLPSCVENIATNVLTSLSFAFSSCILIFEGEVGFLAGIMESSDELYVAAATLGINFQLFCSYSSETTDEIILNSIAHAAKSTRGLYPRMPESETLAESFLSAFPSLNPLSAHAILSSVGTLVEYFEMTHKQRVCALQKYLVPDASITLFSALCRYGEREDSKSGMTDCCSSVSSGHDSGNYCPKSVHELNKRKYPGSPETKAIPMDDLFQFWQKNDLTWDLPKIVDSHNYWNSNAEAIFDDIEKSSKGFDKIYFGENQRSNPCMKMKSPRFSEMSFGQNKKVHTPIVDKLVGRMNYNSKGLFEGYKGEVIDNYDSHNYWNSNAEAILDDIGKSNKGFDKIYIGENQRSNPCMKMKSTSFSEVSFGQNKKVHTPIVNKLVGRTNYNSKGLPEGYKGEVIDIDDDDAIAVEDLSFVNPTNLSSGWCSLPTFSTAAEITSDLDSWIPTKDNGKSSEECSLVNSPPNFSRPPFEEKDPLYGRTPLSEAIFSAQLQKGSPWTADFLNKVKEKSRMHQQSRPNISSAPSFGRSGNSFKFRKRKSPSILDYFRYERSSTVQGMEHKGQHSFTQSSSSSKSVKESPASRQTWTPIDKGVKRKLTFGTNGKRGRK